MPLYAKKATRLRISENWRCIKWKISNFSGSTPVCHLLCSKSRQKFTQTSFAQKLYCIGHIFVPTLKAHVHSVMHGQLWKPQHTYVKCVIWKSHFKLNRAFNFILVGVSRNPEWIVDIMYRNVNRISDTYVNIANCKFVDFNQPTPVWWQLSEKRFRISRKNLYCQKLESLTYISTADSVGLCLLLFTQLFLKVKCSESRAS